MNAPIDTAKAYEEALQSLPEQDVELQLFIAGMGPRSTRAVADLRKLSQLIGERCRLEIIDIYEQPAAAAAAQIIAVPTLVRKHPLPKRKLIGTIGEAAQSACYLELVKGGGTE